MKYIEVEKYKITCIVEQSELFCYGLTLEDIVTRNKDAWIFIQDLKDQAKAATDYEWPGCAFSMQIGAQKNGTVAITFSETIDDFVYNLKQSAQISSNAEDTLNILINKIISSDEETARDIIRSFEQNVREQMSKN